MLQPHRLPYSALLTLLGMPSTTDGSFTAFLENISLSGNHEATADTRRRRLVELLQGKFTVLDTIPTGSIVRDTALKGRADLDIIAVLHYGQHIKDKSPRRVLENLRAALGDVSAVVKKNGQAVTLYYKSWPNVDIVPASRTSNDDGAVRYYEIPDANRGIWIKTRPRRHNESVAKVSAGVRALIRMIKEWNSAHSSLMTSYHIEVLILSLPEVNPEKWPWEINYFFTEAVKRINVPLHHLNGTPGRVDDYLAAADRDEVRSRLIRARDRANAAYGAVLRGNHKEATRLYRMIFGDRFPANG